MQTRGRANVRRWSRATCAIGLLVVIAAAALPDRAVAEGQRVGALLHLKSLRLE